MSRSQTLASVAGDVKVSGRFRFLFATNDAAARTGQPARAFATVPGMTAVRRARPALVVCGPPAAGKSTLGRALAAQLQATVLDQDVLTGPLTAVVSGLLGTSDLDSPELARITRAARYETLLAVAEDNLPAGRPVVLVAPFSTERRDAAAWDALRDRLARAGGEAALVWMRLSGDELLHRMTERAADRDRAKLADPRVYLQRVDLDPPSVVHIAVDAADPLAAQCATVLQRLA